jgi:hypothetical protein
VQRALLELNVLLAKNSLDSAAGVGLAGSLR